MHEYRDFDEFKCLTQITGKLENITPLRIGVGREPPLESVVDLAVFRVNGKPCIPGSSLKGVMRHWSEMLERSKGKIHDPWDLKEIENEGKSGNFCSICGIFGSTELASHVRIYDSVPLTDEPGIIFVKPGIAIDRDFGSVRGGAFFFEEFVRPGVEWKFQMDVINIEVTPETNDDRGKLLYSLLQILKNQGLQVGAKKTTGAGLIKIKEASCKIFHMKNGRIEQYKAWEL
jgi:CRISPR-associated RAMP protein (TIGR02581 family)